ncbi:MAG: hypothetical protein V1896_02090 [Candidatus Zambryskibacteria bacterium]
MREIGLSKPISIEAIVLFWSENADSRLVSMDENTILVSCVSDARFKIASIASDLTEWFKLSPQENTVLCKKLADDWELSCRQYRECCERLS